MAMDDVVDWTLSSPVADQAAPLYTAHQVGMGALVIAVGLLMLLTIVDAVAPSRR